MEHKAQAKVDGDKGVLKAHDKDGAYRVMIILDLVFVTLYLGYMTMTVYWYVDELELELGEEFKLLDGDDEFQQISTAVNDGEEEAEADPDAEQDA